MAEQRRDIGYLALERQAYRAATRVSGWANSASRRAVARSRRK
ncbi:hypothetical protein ACIHFD_57495 [Nonomuraea sp. NPDC051941]